MLRSCVGMATALLLRHLNSSGPVYPFLDPGSPTLLVGPAQPHLASFRLRPWGCLILAHMVSWELDLDEQPLSKGPAKLICEMCGASPQDWLGCEMRFEKQMVRVSVRCSCSLKIIASHSASSSQNTQRSCPTLLRKLHGHGPSSKQGNPARRSVEAPTAHLSP